MGQFNKTFSCRRCRERKIKCDREFPCQPCIAHGCEERCRPYAPPSVSGEKVPIPRTKTLVHPRNRISAIRPSFEPEYSHSYEQVRREHDRGFRNRLHGDTLLNHSIEALHNHFDLTSMKTGTQTKPVTPAFSSFGGTVPLDEKAEWLTYLASNVPPRVQCDVLIAYFFENIHWIYQAIHYPSFMKRYDSLWRDSVGELDLIWLSLLFVLISVSALYIEPHVCESFGLEGTDIRDKAHFWFRLSRQALHVGEYESKPCLTQIQVFVEAQLYWYAVNAVESLSSAMGQAIKCAQAIGLDKDFAQATNIVSEMRHRLWWDLCTNDIFQAFCLGRQPLIQVHLSNVPMPTNCDDSDMSLTELKARPLDEPTRISVQIIRTQIFKALSKLFADNSAMSSSYESVCEVDAEILSIVDKSPWYMTTSVHDGTTSVSLPSAFGYLQWQHHVIHVALCVQRIRMYRPFLRTRHRHACWPKCMDAVESTFAVYHAIRRRTRGKIQHSQKMLVQSYQTFCAAVSIAMFLLVERPTLPSRILTDIEVVMQDLKQLVDINESIPIAKDGRATLAKILGFYHSLRADNGLDIVTREDPSSYHSILTLAQEVYSHMGGTVKTLTYLDRQGQSEKDKYDSRARNRDPTASSSAFLEESSRDETPSQLYPSPSNEQSPPIDIDSVNDDISMPSSWMFDVHFDVMSWPIEDLPWSS